MKKLAFALALLFAPGCGGDDDGGGGADAPTGTPDGAPGMIDAFVPPTGSFTVTFPDVTVAPGQERTQCVVLAVGNTEQARINVIHNTLSQASHHFIVYRTNDTMEQPTPFDCTPFADTLDPAKGSPIMITQKSEETLTLPQGVAFTFQPNQFVRLEMHYINATGDGDVVANATATFTPIPDAEFQNEADFLFIGSPDIDIPPMSTATLGPVFFKVPSNLASVNVFAITGHEHQWGTNVRIATADSNANDVMSVYDVPNWQWDEPETTRFDPPFTIPSGGGFNFTCDWNNLSNTRVQFGESANDEMCFFWAYYYPSQGAFVCVHTDQVPGGADVCCPGNPFICSMLGF